MSNYKHGMTGTKIHNTWLRMIDRCRNDRQGTYGKKGICVCIRWLVFKNFYKDMGEPPSPKHSIDRINVLGDYNPSNCRWATKKQQARNTTKNTILRLDGLSLTIAEWSEKTGIKPSTICQRIYRYKWDTRKALTQKPICRYGADKPWTKEGISKSSWYRKKVLEFKRI